MRKITEKIKSSTLGVPVERKQYCQVQKETPPGNLFPLLHEKYGRMQNFASKKRRHKGISYYFWEIQSCHFL